MRLQKMLASGLMALFIAHPGFAIAQAATPAAAATKKASASANFRSLAEQITAEQLKAYLYFIAADELEGRDTPSRGLNIAAKFIAANLSRWGLKPAGDNNTFFQKIDLSRMRTDVTRSKAELNGRVFEVGTDYLTKSVAGKASGPMVYAGHGWLIKSKNINPYEGLDVKDKIVIVDGEQRPSGITNVDLLGERGVEWDSPVGYAARHGARAVIILPTEHDLANWERNRRALLSRGSLTVDQLHRPSSSSVPVITASIAMRDAIFAGEKFRGEDVYHRVADGGAPPASFALDANKRITLDLDITTEKLETQNVVAVVEGSDPVLKNEYVALGAHYDHVGIGPELNGDKIYNGADDDGSGTCALLAMAETFARNPRPKRSILFVWHAGEEKGLWGSNYFTKFPTVQLNQIVAQLNVDMIGRSKPAGDPNPRNKFLSGPNEIYVIGSRMMSTALGELSDNVNKSYLKLDFNYRYDNPGDPERLFFRSDHYNYAQHGIPIIFYFDGVHEDYHRPGDSPDKIDYAKYEKVTRTIFATAWTLAIVPKRPAVDKQLPGGLKRNTDL